MSALQTLKTLLEVEVEKLIAQEDVVESLRRTIWLLEEGSPKEVRHSVVGRLEKESGQVPPRDVAPERPRVEGDSRLPCNACGGRMEPSQRVLGNGKVVNLLICTDSGCNNEQVS